MRYDGIAAGGKGATAMIQCQDCEYFQRGPDGQIRLNCDPFSTIKEPECLRKWMLIKVNQMVANYQAMMKFYDRLAPLQEKMFKFMEREMEDIDEAEKWKVNDEDEEDEDDWRRSAGDWDPDKFPFE
jgi:hypothetical protein